ncbi:hypothetical protein D9615_008994 [Tricholomella constricta]|uniref:Uncharacterized protein n=1 Tax=Tricholomella constricta TaxID=117010 RepID=A0A8H5LZ14_9AGAR|nr:hypothetical protein D9615_008994 [Tricholomella constricta]
MAKSRARRKKSRQKYKSPAQKITKPAVGILPLHLVETLAATRPRTRQQTNEDRIRLQPNLYLKGPQHNDEIEDKPTKNAKQNHRDNAQTGQSFDLVKSLPESAQMNKMGVRALQGGGRDRREGSLARRKVLKRTVWVKEMSEERDADETEAMERVGATSTSHSTLMETLELMKRELWQARVQNTQTQKLLDEKSAELEGALSFLNQSNFLSGADIVGLTKSLNVDILQGAAYMADVLDCSISLTERGTAEYEKALEQTYASLGRDLAEALRKEAEWGSDKFAVQISLQVCMVTFCANVILSWSAEDHESGVLEDLYKRVFVKENQAVAGRWRSVTRGITRDTRDSKDLVETMAGTLTDILMVAGIQDEATVGTRILFKRFYENLERVVDGALKLRTAVGEDITCMDIVPLTVGPGSPFDDRNMDDVEADVGDAAGDVLMADDADRVLCTIELGLAQTCKGPSGTYQDILLKPKILRRSALSSLENNWSKRWVVWP